MGKKIKSGPARLTRRGFLRCAGCLAGMSLVGVSDRKIIGKANAQSVPRVVSVHDGNATNWDHMSGYHWDYIDQETVNDMVACGVMALTSSNSLSEAWRKLIPYEGGQFVVIKINLNNSMSCDPTNSMDAYPETVNAVIDGLSLIGVPFNNIWVADPSSVIPPRFINRISSQQVRFFSTRSLCTPNSYKTDYVRVDSPAATPTTYPAGDFVRPAQVFVDAHHLINIPLFKGHGGAGITLGMKNHYGSVTFNGNDQFSARQRMHSYLFQGVNPDPGKSILGDVCNNPHIRDKTRLIIGDGLFGNPSTNVSSPIRWKIFGNEDPNILFFGTDPIAADSVMCDYINEERTQIGLPAASRGCLLYGQNLGLGVHDHWDGFLTKIYSSIDYHPIENCDYQPGAALPEAATLPATSITSSSADLTAVIRPVGEGTRYYFEYGINPTYGSTTDTHSIQSQSQVAVRVTGFSPTTAYHYRIVASNAAGSVSGSDVTFKTLSTDESSSGGSGGGSGGGCFLSVLTKSA